MKEWINVNSQDLESRIIKEFGSQAEFSRQSKIPKSTLSDWLKDGRVPLEFAIVFIVNLHMEVDNFFAEHMKYQQEVIELLGGNSYD